MARGAAIATMLAAVTLAAPGCATPRTQPAALKLDRVVLLMRHGVRPPTKNPPMAAGVTSDPWPSWDVAPGYLTSHGAKAIMLVGAFDRQVLIAGLLGAGCPKPGAVSVYSDSGQRPVASGDAWIAGFAPGCHIVNQHKPRDVDDPIFSPLGDASLGYDPAKAEAAVKAGLGTGGIAAVERAQRDVLKRLDAIYCGPTPTPGCGFSNKPTRLDPPKAGSKPGFSGALDLGSTAGQILLLEYADGKPMSDVGWGRATKADIALAGRLHAVEYSVLARPIYVAASNAALFAPKMLAALTDPDAATVSMIVGHDTQLAALAGLLDFHWQVPGFAADDPSPGEAIGFELLRDAGGKRYVRAVLRAQGLDQVRELTPLSAADPATLVTLPIKGCDASDACPLDRFVALVKGRLAMAGR
ncbi:histidine-type phosphatase [Sphingomonas koreensis]|nr:histidine-type phosphatase [Sphingomonas koreensis]